MAMGGPVVVVIGSSLSVRQLRIPAYPAVCSA